MTILLVEDEEVDLKLASRILSHEGHRIVGVRTAEEAILALRDGPRPEVVLTDIMLPAMDGIALTRRLKADPATAAIPVAAMSSHLDAYSIAEMSTAGFSLVIAKPLSSRTLSGQIEALLS